MKTSLKLLPCTTPQEIAAAKLFRQEHFFNLRSIQDPYLWTFDAPGHGHFALYQGNTMIGYAHIQYWPNHRAALRIIVIDEKRRGQGLGAHLLTALEKELKEQGIQLLQTEAAPDVVDFYRRLGYQDMPFNDPDHHPSDESDTPMGKSL
jgi:ribosomal protein S18 acetylase RimI-like enzyme